MIIFYKIHLATKRFIRTETLFTNTDLLNNTVPYILPAFFIFTILPSPGILTGGTLQQVTVSGQSLSRYGTVIMYIHKQDTVRTQYSTVPGTQEECTYIFKRNQDK